MEKIVLLQAFIFYGTRFPTLLLLGSFVVHTKLNWV